MISSNAPTILIVDDEILNRKLLEVLLQPEGYLTESVTNGEEALNSIEKHAPDLILMDFMMPDMDGCKLVGLLKANPATSTIPIIMVTAQIDRSTRLACLHAGAEEFLTKPVDRAELWLRVRNLLRLKAYGDFLRNHSVILEQEVQARTIDLQRFRNAMDTTGEAIFLINRITMCFIEINATALNMFGYTREEFFQSSPAQIAETTAEDLGVSYDAIISGKDMRQSIETTLRRRDGSRFQVEVRHHAHCSGPDWIIVAVARDITERKEAEKRLHHLAHYDVLTGLPNRMLFYETLKNTLEQATISQRVVAVFFIDLDYFKNINDTLGHAAGDDLLCQFSGRLIKCIRARDTVGRMGGDEFALILVLRNDIQDAAIVANKILEALRTPFDLKGHEVIITSSIGITIYPDDASDPDTLLKYADTAMYQAKRAGRNVFRFFTPQMNTDALARLELEMALRKAVENNEFVLHYQPEVQLNNGHIAGLEALLRWQRPGHGMVPPKDFIPALEETGLIVHVGRWVIATVCKQISLWQQSSIGPIQVSVNISERQFTEGNLEGDIIKALRDNNVTADLLELELTETSLMVNTERTITMLQNLRKLGVQISIDDFGTGYSSLAYLRRFPIDKLKIDIAFVRDITTNPDDAAIALAIIRMAHSLKLDVIAEGVKTAAQLTYLRNHHCDQMQGYYFSPPLSALEMQEMLSDDKCLPPFDSKVNKSLKTLLLVDNEVEELAALQRLLRQDGYHILPAQSAAEGFELLALHNVHVVLCDEYMPDMNGTVFLDRVKELYPDTLRIVLSNYKDMDSIIGAINHGAIHRFCSKPWDGKILRNDMREAFRYYSLLHDAPPVSVLRS